MNFYVIKLKHIIIALLIFAVIPIIWFTTSRAVSVFNVNGREIPIYSVERCDNKIALTFDCAWNDDDIDSILDTLDKYNCKATFFVVGDWAEKYSESKFMTGDMKSAIIHIITRIIRKCRQRRLQPTLINVTELLKA